MTTTNECPCYKDGKDCEKRTVTCHSTCPEYATWRDDRITRNDNIRKKKADEAMLINCRIKSLAKITKQKPKQRIWKG